MSKKTYIITAIVFVAVIAGIGIFYLANRGQRQAQIELADAVSAFNKSRRQFVPRNCHEYRAVYEASPNYVSLEYFYDPRFFKFYNYDVMDDHPAQKVIMRRDLEENIVRDPAFRPILRDIVKAGAFLRIAMIDKEDHSSQLVFKWDEKQIKEIVDDSSVDSAEAK